MKAVKMTNRAAINAIRQLPAAEAKSIVECVTAPKNDEAEEWVAEMDIDDPLLLEMLEFLADYEKKNGKLLD